MKLYLLNSILEPDAGRKKDIIRVTGSIAAYKAPLIVRNLIKAGAEVKVVMTPAAKDFVSPLTLSTLSKECSPFRPF
jgi:phosphopantothenoylcysteine synthetase/decarboxylase